jgi:hypothetical protein
VRLRLPAILALALALAGCGSSGPKTNGEESKSAEAIVSDALAATDTAAAVHVAGSGTASGTALSLDLHLVAGKGGAGRLSTNGLSFQMVRIGPKAYFKGDATFWRRFGGGVAAALLEGRWLQASASSGNFSVFTPLTDITKLFHAMLGSHGKLQKGATTTVNGRPAIAILDTEQGATLYVATSGKPYPLEVKGKSKGSFRFDEWDKPADLKTPPNPIDFAKLTG